MTFENAEKLHNGDRVMIKSTKRIVTVLKVYLHLKKNKKYIMLECDNGYTYYHYEVR